MNDFAEFKNGKLVQVGEFCEIHGDQIRKSPPPSWLRRQHSLFDVTPR